jgi:serine/threonine-protein kinase RsbW
MDVETPSLSGMTTMSKIRLPARLENLEKLLQSVSSFAEEKGLPSKRIREIELATEEALVNIFNYAYPEQGTGEVEIDCSTGETFELIIRLIDTGIPFNIDTLSDPDDLDAGLSERKIGGLGVFLIRKMVDEVKYRREGDKNILTLTFRK